MPKIMPPHESSLKERNVQNIGATIICYKFVHIEQFELATLGIDNFIVQRHLEWLAE
jgi:hypothetical protein